MSFCSKCGREIVDETLGCPVCSMMGKPDIVSGEAEVSTPEPEVEKVDAFTVEDEDGVNQRFEREDDGDRKWGAYDGGTAHSGGGEFKATKSVAQQSIPMVLKVIIIIAIVMVGVVGKIAGLIAGVILLKSPIEDYRKFGKIILIVSAALIVLSLLLVVLVGVVNMAMLTSDILYSY